MIHFFVSNESKLVFMRPLGLELSSKQPHAIVMIVAFSPHVPVGLA